MDPLLTAAVGAAIAKVLDGVGSEAGANLWRALTGLVGRFFPERGETRDALAAVTADDPDTIARLAVALTRASHRHHAASLALRQWMEEVDRTVAPSGDVSNVIEGEVRGTVVQARDIHGDIRLTAGEARRPGPLSAPI